MKKLKFHPDVGSQLISKIVLKVRYVKTRPSSAT